MDLFNLPIAPQSQKHPEPSKIFWLEQNPSFKTRYEQALSEVSKRNSAPVINGRDKIVGGSDINNVCDRRIVMNKRHGESDHEFSTLAKFFRGHRQEDFNSPIHQQIAFEDGVCWISQLQLTDPSYPICRCTVDNLYFVSPTGRIEDATSICSVQEKNNKAIPKDADDGYVDQVHYELCIVKGNFPNADVFGFLYATDLNGDHTDFGTLFQYDPVKNKELYDRARYIMEHLTHNTTPKPRTSYLCGFCAHQSDCPAWKNTSVPPEIVDASFRITEISKMEAELKKEKDTLKELVIKSMTSETKTYFKGQVSPGLYVQVQDQKGRKSCNIKLLEKDYPDVAPHVLSQGKGFQVLKVDYRPVEDTEEDKQAVQDAQNSVA